MKSYLRVYNPGTFGGGGAGAPHTPTEQGHRETLALLLEESPFVGSLFVAENGHVEHVDQAASEMLMRTDARFIVGRSFSSVISPRLGRAVTDAIAPETRLLRTVVDGWQLVLTARRGNGNAFTMLVQRRGGQIPPRIRDHQVRFLPCGSLGSLGLLSNREMEVAALIGLGLSVREIGVHLSRSIKTIENHRVAIGRKLGVSDRLDIAMVAHQAGLRPEDVQLERL